MGSSDLPEVSRVEASSEDAGVERLDRDADMAFKHGVIAEIPNAADWRLASRDVAVWLGHHLKSNERTTQ